MENKVIAVDFGKRENEMECVVFNMRQPIHASAAEIRKNVLAAADCVCSIMVGIACLTCAVIVATLF